MKAVTYYPGSIGEYPKAFFLVFEGERNIDTVDFNKNMDCSLAEVDDLLEDLREGIIKSDLSKIAKVSTESIFRNLNRLPYESFNKVKVLQRKYRRLRYCRSSQWRYVGSYLC